ncbi:MAG: cupin domain-containing protein [Candidatus Hydrogenedentes bacterium]|nr:cupin domain-containing protein [Candidatus Hydrogenedentota bacterium]
MHNQFRHYVAAPAGEGETLWFSGALLTVKISADETGGAFSLTEVLGPEGCIFPLHTDPLDETLHVLEGELRLAIGGEQRTITEGDSLMIRRGVPHAIKVLSESARFLTMNGGHDRFYRLAGEPALVRDAPPSGLRDPERLRKAAEETGVALFASNPFREYPYPITRDVPSRCAAERPNPIRETATP